MAAICAGVIRNPKSQRNRASPVAEGPLPPGVLLAMPETPEALTETLRAFAEQGVRDLLIDGGDGTLRDVLGALPASYGERWPSLALCASGNTNLAAADVGSFARGPEAVARWHATLTPGAAARISLRRPIAVHWPDGSRAPVFGFFAGCANYSRAVAIAAGSLKKRGLFHDWAVAAALASAALQVVSGSAHSEWQRGSRLALRIDGAAAEPSPHFVVLVTSLEKLVLRLWPFWSTGQTDGPLRWLDIAAPAPRFARALPALLRGRPKPWMLATGAYRSGLASQLTLSDLTEPLIIDGEAFAPDADGRLELRAGPPIRFHAPA